MYIDNGSVRVRVISDDLGFIEVYELGHDAFGKTERRLISRDPIPKSPGRRLKARMNSKAALAELFEGLEFDSE